MEKTIWTTESNVPSLVIVDNVNGRYAIRKADTSGQVFTNGTELKQWIEQNWNPSLFTNNAQYDQLLKEIQDELTSF
ncbi:hypothetical protein NSQ54_10755 [Alkalihalobacillus sp. FSL W8-0930]